MSNTRSAYRGKYPHRVKTVAGIGTGCVRIESNDGNTWGIVWAKAATWAHGEPRMPQLGDDAREWNDIQDRYEAMCENIRLGLEKGIKGAALNGTSHFFWDPKYMHFGQVSACFLACAMHTAQNAANKMTTGRHWEPATRAASRLLGDCEESTRQVFVHAYVSRIERMHPRGVPVSVSGFIVDYSAINRARIIIGVGLIA